MTGLRLFKLPDTKGPFLASLWTSDGNRLAAGQLEEVTREGWQELHLSAPVPVEAGRSYVVAYRVGGGSIALHAQGRSGSGGGPLVGLGRVRGDGDGFPGRPGAGQGYLVDLVFVRRDTEPPYVTDRLPAPVASRISPDSAVRVTFSEPVQRDSVRITLAPVGGRKVEGHVTLASTGTVATFRPSHPLRSATTYSVRVEGALDRAGNAMAVADQWRFTTAGTQGHAPILVIRPPDSAFADVYAEILRTEGLPAADVVPLGSVGEEALGGRAVVVLPSTKATQGLRGLLARWVGQGGRLVLVRPDADFAELAGMLPSGGTIDEGYLAVDTNRSPGAGVASDPLRFHGAADLWERASAEVVATLLRDPATATAHPAVAINRVGSGLVAAFTYDVARSIVLTRQGNPEWAGDNRDGDLLVRSDDLFFGAKDGDTAPDWIDLGRALRPDADEQQRLLANVVGALTEEVAPLPRFWYLPRGLAAAVVMTGDDHRRGGTVEQFRHYEALSPKGCSVARWECVRATSYVYEGTLPPGLARRFAAEGFEVAAHPAKGCADWSPASLDEAYREELAAWRRSFPGLSPPSTNRNHCVTWSTYTGAAEIERRHGIRLDTTYYYYPPSWVRDRPGWFTGSALPMRFVTTGGRVLDVYQAPTQINDESDQSLPHHIDALLEQATGPGGAAAVVTANMHTDFGTSAGSDVVMRAAFARKVPVISARQLLEWLDARSGSSIESVAFDGTTLRFFVTAAAGADGLEVMVPAVAGERVATNITCGGGVLAATARVLAGRSYLVVPARTGACEVSYQPGRPPLAIDRARAMQQLDGSLRVEWETDSPASSAVVGEGDAVLAADQRFVTRHALVVAGLEPGTSHRLRVRSVDASGAVATFELPPVRAQLPAILATPTAGFRAGSTDGVVVRPDGITLAARLDSAVGDLFGSWSRRGGTVVRGREVVLDGGSTRSADAPVTWGQAVEFDATFTGPHQTVGVGRADSGPSFRFTTDVAGRRLLAVVEANGRDVTVPIHGEWVGRRHRFRIDTGGGRVTFWIDGLTVAQVLARRAGPQPLDAFDTVRDGNTLQLSGVRVSPYVERGTFTSAVVDGRGVGVWGKLGLQAVLPVRSGVKVEVRTGNTPRPDAGWSNWRSLAVGDAVGRRSRYLQYRITLSSAAPGRTPMVRTVWLERTR